MRNSTSELENKVRECLADLLAAGPVPSSRHAAVDARMAKLDQRFVQRRRLLAGTAAATLVGSGLVWVLNRDHAADQRVGVGPSGPVGPESSTEWRRIDPAPLSDRVNPAVVWAEDRLLVWGGVVAGGPSYLVPPDGVAWSAASASWDPIAPAPAGAIVGGFAIWDGTEMLVGLIEGDADAPWNDQSSEANPLDGIAAYNPRSNTWRYVAPIAGDRDERLGSARQAVLVSGGLLVAIRQALPVENHDADIVFIATADGAASPIDPGPFAASPYPDASGEVALTTIGDLVVATPNWDLRPWVLDPTSGTWRQASPPPTATSLLPCICFPLPKQGIARSI